MCYQTGRVADSRTWLQKTLIHAPQSLPTLQLLIRICDETADADGALEFLGRYLSLQPNDAGLLNVKGRQLIRLGQFAEAEQAFRQATEVNGNAALFHDLGLSRKLLGDLAGAVIAFQEAIKRGYGQPLTRLWLAQCLRALGRTREYYDVITSASVAAPDDIDLLIEAQSARRYVCDWNGFEQHQSRLLDGLKHALEKDIQRNIPPGILNYLDVDEATVAAIARRYARQISTAGDALKRKLPQVVRGKHNKIRLGYLSTDFFSHAVGSLVRNLFACHDRSQFEVYGYSLRHQPDAVQADIQQGCDVYRNLSGKSEEEVARSIAEDQIDILLDLAGYTSAAQPAVLAARPAPIQISWLGYLGTSGGGFIDYIIADDIVLPPEVAQFYSERIIRLDNFLVTSPLPVANTCPSRQEAGLAAVLYSAASTSRTSWIARLSRRGWIFCVRCQVANCGCMRLIRRFVDKICAGKQSD